MLRGRVSASAPPLTYLLTCLREVKIGEVKAKEIACRPFAAEPHLGAQSEGQHVSSGSACARALRPAQAGWLTGGGPARLLPPAALPATLLPSPASLRCGPAAGRLGCLRTD
jgi:hypothetical protein